MSRTDIKLIAVVVVCATLALAGPAAADGVRHAMFAHNADKVDGKHAVGAGTSVTARKGRLVATHPTTGLLPNNIIARAPDADRLGGFPHSSLRTMSISPQSAYVDEGGLAAMDRRGVVLPKPSSPGDSAMWVSFVVPADHAPANAVKFRVTYALSPPPGSTQTTCGVTWRTESAQASAGTTPWPIGDRWRLPNASTIQTVPTPVNTARTLDLTWNGTAAAGTSLLLGLHRHPVNDTCEGLSRVFVLGLQVIY